MRLRPPRYARALPGVWGYEGNSMRRKLFTFFLFVSLLLCVGVCVLWVRSLARCDSVGYTAGNWGAHLMSEDTRLTLAVARSPIATPSRQRGFMAWSRPSEPRLL